MEHGVVVATDGSDLAGSARGVLFSEGGGCVRHVQRSSQQREVTDQVEAVADGGVAGGVNIFAQAQACVATRPTHKNTLSTIARGHSTCAERVAHARACVTL